MRVAIMQPYFLPYVGYFQLLAAVDVFVVYDNIKYTKKGWINRNRFLLNGRDALFSLPLKKDSDQLDVRDRVLAEDFDRAKLLGRFREAYRRAPFFHEACPLVESAVLHAESNLFRYILHSLELLVQHLGIGTRLVVSSAVPADHRLQGEEKVLAICAELGATTYINAIGGQGLYSKERFRDRRVELNFLRSAPFTYRQFDHEFVPWLSILDVIMFNPPAVLDNYLRTGYTLI